MDGFSNTLSIFATKSLAVIVLTLKCPSFNGVLARPRLVLSFGTEAV